MLFLREPSGAAEPHFVAEAAPALQVAIEAPDTIADREIHVRRSPLSDRIDLPGSRRRSPRTIGLSNGFADKLQAKPASFIRELDRMGFKQRSHRTLAAQRVVFSAANVQLRLQKFKVL